jgi:hypothetical protein
MFPRSIGFSIAFSPTVKRRHPLLSNHHLCHRALFRSRRRPSKPSICTQPSSPFLPRAIFGASPFKSVDENSPTRYLALIYDQASAGRSWHTGKTLMGLRESLQGIVGMNWEALEEDLLNLGHHNCVINVERYNFTEPLIR